MRTWFYGFTKMWVCADKGLFGCLFACWCVGMSAYCLLTAPSFHKNTRPLSWWREGRRVFHSILFVTSFAKYVRFLLSNFITILVCFNPFGVVYQFCFGFIHT